MVQIEKVRDDFVSYILIIVIIDDLIKIITLTISIFSTKLLITSFVGHISLVFHDDLCYLQITFLYSGQFILTFVILLVLFVQWNRLDHSFNSILLGK